MEPETKILKTDNYYQVPNVAFIPDIKMNCSKKILRIEKDNYRLEAGIPELNKEQETLVIKTLNVEGTIAFVVKETGITIEKSSAFSGKKITAELRKIFTDLKFGLLVDEDLFPDQTARPIQITDNQYLCILDIATRLCYTAHVKCIRNEWENDPLISSYLSPDGQKIVETMFRLFDNNDFSEIAGSAYQIVILKKRDYLNQNSLKEFKEVLKEIAQA